MIAEFSISNISSIRDKQTLSFEVKRSEKKIDPKNYFEMPDGKRILKIMCVFGANASGKTNLLYALDFFLFLTLNGFREFNANTPIPINAFKFDNTSTSKPSSFSIDFYIGTTRYFFSMEIQNGAITFESLYYRQDKSKKLLYERTGNEIKWAREVRGAKRTIEESLRSNCTVLNIGAQLNNDRLKNIYDALNNSYLPMQQQGSLMRDWKILHEDVWINSTTRELLKAAGLGEITKIDAEPQKIPDEMVKLLKEDVIKDLLENDIKVWDPIFTHTVDDKDFNVGINFESAGVQRFVTVLKPILTALKDNMTLSVDELEHSLNFELLEFILSVFRNSSKGAQLIIATHSLALLDSEILSDSQLCFAVKNSHAISSYIRASEIKHLRKDVSRLTLYKRSAIDGYMVTNKSYEIPLNDNPDSSTHSQPLLFDEKS